MAYTPPSTAVVVDVKVRTVEEVRQEIAREFATDISELLHDLSWRATRYGMDGQFTEHDVMTEAYGQVAYIFDRSLLDEDGNVQPCDCRDRYEKNQENES